MSKVSVPQKTGLELYLRNGIFGVSDSLVSTVGLLSGINANGTSRHAIIVTGIVYAFVESFSMAVGSFLSEESAENYVGKGEVAATKPFVGGSVMFVTFILASLIPIAPYLFLSAASALWVSIVVSILALFIVGYLSAKISKARVLKHAIRMALLGGLAIIVGVVVGKFVNSGM